MSDRPEMNFRVDALADLRVQFVQALEAEPAAVEREPAARRASAGWFRHRSAWAIGLTAAVAIVIAGFFVLQGGGVRSVQDATAEAADNALAATYPPVDWYTYTDEILTGRQFRSRPGFVGPSYPTRYERRSWLSVARPGVIVSRDLTRPGSDPVIAKYPASSKYRIGEKAYTREQIDAFAQDPAALTGAIDAEAGAAQPGYREITKWTILSEALSSLSPPLPPAVRSGLIRELATIPGARVADGDTDPAGRPATGVYLDFQDSRHSIYFAKSSGATSWTGITALVEAAGDDPAVHKGDVIESSRVLEQRAVPKLPPDAVTALSQAEVPN